ncbi:hypothetical protein Zmor_009713 [Zophobas morio]|uniref:Uncharacterized protein n=1 Tax=Zophobas morio TaxID=2755281 RepID=A0AA38MIU3_9CUCU|nr:hypothetical protein Zmor_009713 [Zophobas morio]
MSQLKPTLFGPHELIILPFHASRHKGHLFPYPISSPLRHVEEVRSPNDVSHWWTLVIGHSEHPARFTLEQNQALISLINCTTFSGLRCVFNYAFVRRTSSSAAKLKLQRLR